MSAKSRRKGAEYERSIVNELKAAGHDVARNLDQVRDGGGDIPFGEWLIECKRRKTIAIYDWWHQCLIACRRKTQAKVTAVEHQTVHYYPVAPKPLLVIRADGKESLAVMRLTDFLDLVDRSSNPGVHPETVVAPGEN